MPTETTEAITVNVPRVTFMLGDVNNLGLRPIYGPENDLGERPLAGFISPLYAAALMSMLEFADAKMTDEDLE